MTFVEAVRVCLKDKYCCFRGRAPRSEFWWFALFMLLVNVAVNVVATFLSPGAADGVSALISLAFLLPNIGLAARRLHDRNLSGWWQLAPVAASLPPAVLGLYAALGGDLPRGEGTLIALAVLAAAVGIWFLAMLILRGTPGPNRFGPDPLAARAGHPQAAPGAGLPNVEHKENV